MGYLILHKEKESTFAPIVYKSIDDKKVGLLYESDVYYQSEEKSYEKGRYWLRDEVNNLKPGVKLEILKEVSRDELG